MAWEKFWTAHPNTVRAEMIINITKAGLGCLRSSWSKLAPLLMLDAQIIIRRNRFLGVFVSAASTDTYFK